MKKRTLMMALAIAAALLIATTGTLAYLTDEDGAVNVMTLGNVDIEQLEFERVVDENGDWISTGEEDKYGYIPDEIQEFTQNKPLFPAVFQDGKIKWDDRNGSGAASGEGSHQQSWGQVVSEAGNPASGSNQLFDDSVKNVIDKFVFVENTGKSDAYVRTWFAFEVGDVPVEDFDKVISMNKNDANGESGSGHWAWEWVSEDAVEIDGNNYLVAVATYLGPKSNPNGILEPGMVSYPSLLQVYMKPEATNEDCEAIDGNDNGTYDILVLSQAIQTTGFEDATDALNEGFGEATAENVPWDTVKWPGYIYSTEDMYDAAVASGDYILGSDYTVSASPEGKAYNHYRQYALLGGKDLTVDLNNHTINHEVSYTGYTYLYTVTKDCVLTLDGNGTINSSNPGNTNPSGSEYSVGNTIAYAQSGGKIVVEDGNYNIQDGIAFWAGSNAQLVINGGTFTSDNTGDYEMIYAYNTSVIDIYGGLFQQKGNGDILNVQNSGVGGRINLYGGTFVNYHPQEDIESNDKPYIKLAEGYTVVSETQDNGDIWYTVVKE